MNKFKVIVVVAIIIVIGFCFSSLRSHRYYHREGLVSTFTHSAVRGAGSYVGYRAAKHLLGGDRHRERRHHYGYYN